MRRHPLPHPGLLAILATMAYCAGIGLSDWLARPVGGWQYLVPLAQ